MANSKSQRAKSKEKMRIANSKSEGQELMTDSQLQTRRLTGKGKSGREWQRGRCYTSLGSRRRRLLHQAQSGRATRKSFRRSLPDLVNLRA